MIDMTIAVPYTVAVIVKLKNEFLAAGTAQSSIGTGPGLILAALAVGGGIGACFVGAITFSGSVIVFGKLPGRYQFRLFQGGAPVMFPGQHWLNVGFVIAMLGFGIAFLITQEWVPFLVILAVAFVLGVLIIIPTRKTLF